MAENITNFTTLDNLKLKNTQTESGVNTDEVLVRNPTDDFVRGISVADLIEGTNTLNAVLLSGNTTDQQAIFTNTGGDTGTVISPTQVSVYDNTNHRYVGMGVGELAVSDSDTQEWFTIHETGFDFQQNNGFNKLTQNVDSLSGANKVVTWRNLSGVPALIGDIEGKFIPIDGTEVSNPVAGDIEFMGLGTAVALKQEYLSGQIKKISFEDDNSLLLEVQADDQTASLSVRPDAVTITATSPLSEGLVGQEDFSANIGDLGYTQKIYVDGLVSTIGTELPDNFLISAKNASTLIAYKTDTWRYLDVSTLVGTTVTNTNDIVRNGNDLFIIGNFIDNATSSFILRLQNCKIVNDILTFESSDWINTGVPKIHGTKYADGFVYVTGRADDNLLPQIIGKINAYDFGDIKRLSLPVSGDYVGATTDIIPYKNQLYIFIAKGSSNPAYMVKIDNNLNSYSTVFSYGATIGKRVCNQSPFLIYNDEFYIPNVDRTTGVFNKIGMAVFDMNGNLKREVFQQTVTIDPSETSFPSFHWIGEFNGKIIVGSTSNYILARFDSQTLAIEESTVLNDNIAGDNAIDRDGYMYISETSAGGNLLKIKYNEFSDSNIEVSGLVGWGTCEITPVNKESLKTKLSDFGNDIITSTINDGDTTHSPDGNSVYDALVSKESTANKNVSGGYAGIVMWPETTYAQTITFTSSTSDPTGTLIANYRATQLGKMVTLRVNFNFATPGSGTTVAFVPLPTGLPIPSDVTGFTAANSTIGFGTGSLITSTTSTGAAFRTVLRRVSTGVYQILLTGASGAYSGGEFTLTYWTD